ncbi:hypothetical protein SOVF_034970 [Spinacia oleracea]|nr:hypothetical protein SOVF_034970 [Spinacia oleracea]
MKEWQAELSMEAREMAIEELKECDKVTDKWKDIKKKVGSRKNFLEIVKADLFNKKGKETETETKKMSCSEKFVSSSSSSSTTSNSKDSLEYNNKKHPFLQQLILHQLGKLHQEKLPPPPLPPSPLPSSPPPSRFQSRLPGKKSALSDLRKKSLMGVIIQEEEEEDEDEYVPELMELNQKSPPSLFPSSTSPEKKRKQPATLREEEHERSLGRLTQRFSETTMASSSTSSPILTLNLKKKNINNNDTKLRVRLRVVTPPPAAAPPDEFIRIIRAYKGTNVKLVIEKPITNSDCDNGLDRFNFGFTNIVSRNILRENEKESLGKEGIHKQSIVVMLIEPSLEVTSIDLRCWKVGYVLTNSWRRVKERNKIEVEQNFQIWSFRYVGEDRVGDKLGFALVPAPKSVPVRLHN